MEYDNRGRVSMWKNDKTNGPTVSGKLVAHRDIKEGETLEIALWKQEAVGNQPILKGKISDVYNSSAPSTGVDSDDIPF